MGIFSLFATPLGYLLKFICQYLPNYLLAIFVFTFLVKLLLFPVNISNQKNAAAKARLAPRLERIQKKYGSDRQKLMEKQQALYEKEGVKMTAGCLPQILQMLVLFSIIAVIYMPLTYVESMEAADINACIEVVQQERVEDLELTGEALEKKKQEIAGEYTEGSYYRELNLLNYVDNYETAITDKLVATGKTPEVAKGMVASMKETQSDFSILGVSLLEIPNKDGITPNWLWIIAILSGASAMLTSIQSMRHQKLTMPETQQQPGCTKWMMYGMPLMSLIFSFIVPAGVAVYWIFSNLLALLQTIILNKMYDPVKIRAQAELEYQERRRRKAEDRERLKQARLEEQRAWQMEENEKKAQKQGKKPVKKTEEPAEDGKEEDNNE
ncbi:MAG: membrane protein insertase YidC [Ruminococcaceae bacterium]|nr:membrane protein insertase YidC [Oscillospiraceae bacterium]